MADTGQLTLPSLDANAAATAVADTASSLLLDVREYDEWMTGRAPGATHIAMSELVARVGELDRNRRVVCVCRSGNRSARVVAWLIGQGFDAVNLNGGVSAWQAAGHPVVNHNGNPGFIN
jgi:rhodanese-related sulfurtransferase